MSRGYATFFQVIAWIFAIIFGIAAILILFLGLGANTGMSSFLVFLIYAIGGVFIFVMYSAISQAILQLISTHEKVQELEYKLDSLPAKVAAQMLAEMGAQRTPIAGQKAAPSQDIAPTSQNPQARIADTENKVVAIDRTQREVTCPFCQTLQRSDRNVCFKCGAKFVEAFSPSDPPPGPPHPHSDTGR